MDYLRTLGSAAVSTLVQKSGLNLPFSLGAKVASIDGVCNLYDATKREDGSNVSVFEYDFNDASKRNYKPFAKNSLRKLRTTRHPDILRFMDAVESETNIYIMTERVRPLEQVLQQWSSRPSREREDWLLWGLHRISVALTFVNDPCASTHGNIHVSSIFISPSGEWKLGGFELCSSPKDESPTLYTLGGTYPNSSSWSSPEVRKSGWSALKEVNSAIADAYALGLLLHNVFNPTHPPLATIQPPHPPLPATSRGEIPLPVFNAFKRLLNPGAGARLTPKGFLELGMAEGGFFSSNKLVQVCSGLDNFALASEADKNQLLRSLKESASSFPAEFASFKVLPSLVSALEYGGASAATILPLLLQFGKNVSPEDYPTLILAPLIKLYASPDRAIRMELLERLPEYIENLDQKAVSDKIFPHLQTGFLDTVAVIREATVKAVSLLAPKMSPRILNNELLRHLAKMQKDPEASIRTNTCILIGRLGPTLGYNTKRKVLVPAFVCALKDSFVHARVAGLMAFMATMDCFEVEELATKVIPCVSPTLLDKEKVVRDQAFKAVELFMSKLSKHAESMPEVVGMENIREETPYSAPNTLTNSAAGAAGALAGWAMSSLGKTLATSDLLTTMATAPTTERPNSTSPTPAGSSLQVPAFDSFSNLTITATSSLITAKSSGKGKAMQLGGQKVSAETSTTTWIDEESFDSSVANDAENPWGSDDLMDVNADQDDWSAFESAPLAPSPPKVVEPKPRPSSFTRNLSSSTPKNLSVHSTPPTPYSVPTTPLPSMEADSSRLSGVSPASKEDRATEMARRKEERKQRIAMLKEQKKTANKG